MRFLVYIYLLGASLAAAQTAQAPPKLTGFPFQDETLRYNLRWPSGLSLGEAVFSARHSASGWAFETTLDASIPAFLLRDAFTAHSTDALCSLDFDRSFTHGAKKSREKTTFDEHNRRATRLTTVPPDGGKSDFDVLPCARDAVTFLYFARREMGQGRVAPPETVYFGAGYSVRLQYTGEMSIPVQNKPTVTDRVVVSIKGPRADATAEVYFARDPARTPLLVKIPLSLGTVSVELVR